MVHKNNNENGLITERDIDPENGLFSDDILNAETNPNADADAGDIALDAISGKLNKRSAD